LSHPPSPSVAFHLFLFPFLHSSSGTSPFCYAMNFKLKQVLSDVARHLILCASRHQAALFPALFPSQYSAERLSYQVLHNPTSRPT
jgi:hypothetical protein